MNLLVTVLLALAMAVTLGQVFSHDPGMVVLTYGGTVLRTSLFVAVVVVGSATLLTVVLLRMLWQLVTLRRRLGRWRRERRLQRRYQNLNGGLLALAAGEYQQAERLLTRDAGDEVAAGHLLAAAQAAHGQQATERRDRLLALARANTQEHALAIDLQTIEMQMADGNAAAAETALADVATRYPKHKRVLDLQQRSLAARGKWDEFTGLLPHLKRAQVYPPARLTELEAEGAAQLLSKPYASRSELTSAWDTLPKTTRTVPIVLAAYATVLLQLQETVEAEKVLRKALVATWDPRLIAVYGELRAPDPSDTIRQAESWLAQHREDPDLLLALGRLCLTAELWGKARGYLEAALARAPSALGYRLLADAAEHLNEPALATRQRQLGLDFATRSKGQS
ncbi:MAG: hypothetical protein EXR86_09245 [Gammaproteobacteria bacterium]|nr:hypothetical protein [Gammaproteobacteria bacterium]